MLNNRMRSARIQRGLTLQEVAEELSITLRTYQRYEQGTVQPPLVALVSFADLVNLPTDWLLGRDDFLESLGVVVDVSESNPPRRPKYQ